MRRSFTIFLLSLLIHQVTAQFVDDFSDGDFTNNPVWAGSTDLFIVESDGGNNRLRSNAGQLPLEVSYVLSTPSTSIDNTTWEFFIDLRFPTSGVNFVDVHLVSDDADVSNNQNGYFVRVGESTDRIVLYPIFEGTLGGELLASPNGITENESFFIRVTRDALGNWNMVYDEDADGSFVNAGDAFDNNVTSSSFFGLRIRQSTASSPANNHFFDNFFVGQDTSPPTISSVDVISQTAIDVTFSENVDQTTAEIMGNYFIDGGIVVNTATLDGANSSLVHLTTSALTNGATQTLTVSGVEDEAGNAIASEQAQFQYLIFSEATFRDVQINEFLSDPGEDSGLPNADFVELFNNTANYYNLAGWRLFDAVGGSSFFPTYTLSPGEYVILCHEDFVPNFESFGDVIGFSSFPSFNNTDDQITIQDDNEAIIDQVVYGDVADEGISNEQVNPDLICSGDFNFKPSEAAIGGTPATENSVLMIVQDGFAPELVLGRALTADSVRLDFDEFLNAVSVDLEDFSISPSVTITHIFLLDEYPESVFLKLGENITENTAYTATASGISDCSGNSTNGTSIDFLLGISPEDDDILLSEILFNPVSGAFDFVEIYNPSSTENFELRGWKLARLVGGEIDDPTPFAEDGLILNPGGFLFFSEEIPTTRNFIQISTYVELSVPSYNDDAGTVLLLNADDEIVQQFDYLDDYHYALLEDEEGVSLERVSYTAEVNDPNNWRSAASTAGFQTPGVVNSQSVTQTENLGQLTIEPKVFLPGNSGSGRDFTTINYKFNQPGQFANVMVYDQSGRPVKELANGASLSTSGFIRWDGETDRGGMARMGYYVVVFEVYDGNGKTNTLKETVVVGRDF